jgi:tetratricopeptide (TPR) repeat protein
MRDAVHVPPRHPKEPILGQLVGFEGRGFWCLAATSGQRAMSVATNVSELRFCEMPDRQICLSMIVKNEASVIARCIASVKPHITAWAVVDTGSTDGTQDMIRELLKDMRGQLIERPWKNFAHNRNEALDLARGQGDGYVLALDADDVLNVEQEKQVEFSPEVGGYQLRIEYGETSYDRIALVRTSAPWRWVGVVHEVLTCEVPVRMERLRGWSIRCLSGGARSAAPGVKFLRDIELLEQARAENPNETRAVFYLAQSYRDAGQLEKAVHIYKERVSMGGWEEEVFCARLQVARLLEQLGRWNEALTAYFEAFESRPIRAEPLYSIARHYREQRQFHTAMLFAAKAMRIVQPADILFVEEGVYQWRALDEYAVAAYWIGEYDTGLRVNQQLLGSTELPEAQRDRVRQNLELCRAKLRN